MTLENCPGNLAGRGEFASLSESLKSIIRERGLTAYAVAMRASVRPHVVQRFLNGERGLTLSTADKLANVLGLELCPRGDRARDSGLFPR